MRNKNVYCICAVLVTMVFVTSCGNMWGSNNLGNSFSLLEGDQIEDRVIVYCGRKNGGTCKGGTYVVPTYKNHYDENGKYAEYVETAKSNKNWIIAKSIQINQKKENYWIISKNVNTKGFDCDKINCDSIIQSHVTGPLNFSEFKKKSEELHIDLNFK